MSWYIIRNADKLEHHGIDGMHWGVRNGPPYPLSREKHNKVVRSAKDSKKFTKSDRQLMREYESELLDDADRYKERGQSAAVLGLKALHKMGRDVGATEFEDQGARDWFLREDQTIGLAEIADLMNRNKSAEDVKDLIEGVNEEFKKWVFDRDAQDTYTPSNSIQNIYEGTNGGRNTASIYKFVDACAEIKAMEKKY